MLLIISGTLIALMSPTSACPILAILLLLFLPLLLPARVSAGGTAAVAAGVGGVSSPGAENLLGRDSLAHAASLLG